MERTYLILIGIFLLSTTGCRYHEEKIDTKIVGLWEYDNEYRPPFYGSSGHHLRFFEDYTFSRIEGLSNDTADTGDYPYNLSGGILTRYYPDGARQDEIIIKWRAWGKVLILKHIQSGDEMKYFSKNYQK